MCFLDLAAIPAGIRGTALAYPPQVKVVTPE
jgi:hypothetical protein